MARSRGRGAAWRAVVKKHGGNFKAAARAWRKMRKPRYAANPWRDDPVGHSVAAVKGWRKRGKRAKSRPKSWKTRQRRKAHVRRLPKGLRRYARRGTVRVAANPSRRSRPRRNILTNILTNPRRRRSYRRNPGGQFLSTFKQLLNKDLFIEGATVTGGMLAAVAVPNLVLNLGPVRGLSFLDFARRGWGSYLVSLLAAGAASGVAAYFGKQKLARGLLMGGVAGTILRIVSDVVVPMAPAQVQAALKAPGAGLLGMGDDVEAAVEQAVNAELARQGIGDYMVPAEAANPTLGDFLTVGDVSTTGLEGDAGAVDPVYAEDEGYM